MDPLLTPTTALLYSLLEDEAFESPRQLSTNSASDDIFAQAFLDHTNGYDSNAPSSSWNRKSYAFANPVFPSQQQTPPLSSGKSASIQAVRQKYNPEIPESLSLSPWLDHFELSSLESTAPVYEIPNNDRGVIYGGSEDVKEPPQDDFVQFMNAIDDRFQRAREVTEQHTKPPIISEEDPLPPSPLASSISAAPTPAQPESPFSPPPVEHLDSSISPETGCETTTPITQPEVKAPPKRRNRRRKVLTAAEEEKKHKAFLERNRVAAGKCRMRRKGWMQDLEEDVRTKERQNLELKMEYMDLVNEVAMLRDMVGRCTAVGEGEMARDEKEDGERDGGDPLDVDAIGERTSVGVEAMPMEPIVVDPVS